MRSSNAILISSIIVLSMKTLVLTLATGLCLLGQTPAAKKPAASAAKKPAASRGSLLNPASLNAKAPDLYKAKFTTTKGDFVIEVHRDWAPFGADRFYNLVRSGYYDDGRFFRVIAGFMAQFGIHGDPHVAAVWRDARIPDDPVRQHNARGMVSFATAGPGTRTTQLFINYSDNSRLHGMGSSPFGRVVLGT